MTLHLATEPRRGPDWANFKRGPDYCVVCKADLKPLPRYIAREMNPTCADPACRREVRRSWRASRDGTRDCVECGREIDAGRRRDTRYCDAACRQAHRRAR